MATPKVDNTTYRQKVALRRQAVDLLEAMGVPAPVVMETHGGEGRLFDKCYAHLDQGVVFEKDSLKAARLAKQRPTWAVYEADCVEAVEVGAGGHLVVDLLDADPYGQPWEVLGAFFSSPREYAERMVVVVNDGMRLKLATGSGWEVQSLQSVVRRFGNDLHPIYLEVCEILLGELAEEAGYKMTSFSGYYCGHSKSITHYLAVLERK